MDKLNLLIISGSQRSGSASNRLVDYLITNEVSQLKNVDVDTLRLSEHKSLLDNYFEPQIDTALLEKAKSDVYEKLYRCDAVIFVVPEWGGMIPPAMVNLLLLTANGSAKGLPLGNKPAYVIGVSASSGGSNVISLVKAYAAKNSHMTWLSQHAIVNNVEEMLNYSWSPNTTNRLSTVQSRIQTGVASLLIYAKQLKPVRAELNQLASKHPYGQ